MARTRMADLLLKKLLLYYRACRRRCQAFARRCEQIRAATSAVVWFPEGFIAARLPNGRRRLLRCPRHRNIPHVRSRPRRGCKRSSVSFLFVIAVGDLPPCEGGAFDAASPLSLYIRHPQNARGRKKVFAEFAVRILPDQKSGREAPQKLAGAISGARFTLLRVCGTIQTVWKTKGTHGNIAR